jgi:hypothetical protein
MKVDADNARADGDHFSRSAWFVELAVRVLNNGL